VAETLVLPDLELHQEVTVVAVAREQSTEAEKAPGLTSEGVVEFGQKLERIRSFEQRIGLKRRLAGQPSTKGAHLPLDHLTPERNR
jgi:hypothetical protein